MSSFLVGDKTINHVIGWLNHSNNRHELRKVLEVAEIGQTDPDWMDKLGVSMYQLNVDALYARYKDRDHGADYKFAWENVSAVQAYKSLRCWLYQCAEGDIDSRPLFQVFAHTVTVGIAQEIIGALPEWDAADWG